MSDNEKSTEEKLRQIADSALMIFVSRLSAPIILGLCAWTLTNISDMKVTVATLTVKIEDQGARLTSVETWRSSFWDAYAAEPIKTARPAAK